MEFLQKKIMEIEGKRANFHRDDQILQKYIFLLLSLVVDPILAFIQRSYWRN